MLSENLKLQLFTQHFCGKLVRSARKDDQCAAEHDHCRLSGMEERTPFPSPGVWYAHVGLFLLLLLTFGSPSRVCSAVFSKYI